MNNTFISLDPLPQSMLTQRPRSRSATRSRAEPDASDGSELDSKGKRRRSVSRTFERSGSPKDGLAIHTTTASRTSSARRHSCRQPLSSHTDDTKKSWQDGTSRRKTLDTRASGHSSGYQAPRGTKQLQSAGCTLRDICGLGFAYTG